MWDLKSADIMTLLYSFHSLSLKLIWMIYLIDWVFSHVVPRLEMTEHLQIQSLDERIPFEKQCINVFFLKKYIHFLNCDDSYKSRVFSLKFPHENKVFFFTTQLIWFSFRWNGLPIKVMFVLNGHRFEKICDLAQSVISLLLKAASLQSFFLQILAQLIFSQLALRITKQ